MMFCFEDSLRQIEDPLKTQLFYLIRHILHVQQKIHLHEKNVIKNSATPCAEKW